MALLAESVHGCMRVSMCVFVRVRVYMCVCVYICVCVHLLFGWAHVRPQLLACYCAEALKGAYIHCGSLMRACLRMCKPALGLTNCKWCWRMA